MLEITENLTFAVGRILPNTFKKTYFRLKLFFLWKIRFLTSVQSMFCSKLKSLCRSIFTYLRSFPKSNFFCGKILFSSLRPLIKISFRVGHKYDRSERKIINYFNDNNQTFYVRSIKIASLEWNTWGNLTLVIDKIKPVLI